MRMKYRSWYVISILVITLSACARKAGDSSNVRIQLPKAPTQLRSLANVSLTNPAFCYYVNVLGSGIDQAGASCAPARGVASGFVIPETVVTLEVPKGSGRTVELFGYVPQGSETCATLGPVSSVSVKNLYRLAQKTGIDMTGDETKVELEENFPGLSNHYGLQASLPASCYSNPVTGPSPSGLDLNVGSKFATSAEGMTMKGRIGGKVPKKILTAVDGTKLEVR